MWIANAVRQEKVIQYITQYGSKGGRLLDVGCNRGEYLTYFNRLGYFSIGVDVSEHNLQMCKLRGFNVTRADVTKTLPFKNNYFDIVYAGEVLEHVYDTKKAVSELYRVIKQGGLLVVTTPNLVNFSGRLRVLLGDIPWISVEPWIFNGHIRTFNLTLFKKLVEDAGFKCIHSTSSVFGLPTILQKRCLRGVLSLLGDWFPTFGFHIILVARK